MQPQQDASRGRQHGLASYPSDGDQRGGPARLVRLVLGPCRASAEHQVWVAACQELTILTWSDLVWPCCSAVLSLGSLPRRRSP